MQGKINEHIPLGSCVYTMFAYGESYKLTETYKGKDLMEHLVKHFNQKAIKSDNIPQRPMIPLTPQEWRRHNLATKCHICNKRYQEFNNPKVRDHCHYTGKYRGPAYRNCNLAYRIPQCIPVLAHNVSGYDSHLMIRELASRFPEGKISAITQMATSTLSSASMS